MYTYKTTRGCSTRPIIMVEYRHKIVGVSIEGHSAISCLFINPFAWSEPECQALFFRLLYEGTWNTSYMEATILAMGWTGTSLVHCKPEKFRYPQTLFFIFLKLSSEYPLVFLYLMFLLILILSFHECWMVTWIWV